MRNKALAQVIKFDEILDKALPGYPNPDKTKINLKDPNLSIGQIISALLPYIFTIAGLILFFYLIWAGFEMLTSTGNPKKLESARGRLGQAIVGFIIIFVSYWLAKILETVLGIDILGTSPSP